MAFLSFMQAISFIYLFVVFTCPPVASLLSHDEDCLALFQFKQTHFRRDDSSFDDSGGFQKSNLSDNNRSDCCFWKGVFCSSEDRVTGLDLSQSSLHGRINSNSSLFKLDHLQKLNLSMNDFAESHIPSEIARLKQLRILDLSYSGFSGQIPKEISHLVHLSVLDLSWNMLKLQNFSLGYLLENMTRLENLHLTEVAIGSSVPHFLANFSSLRSIKLVSCGLQDEFPSSIFQLPKLKYFIMENNPDLTGSLPEFGNHTLLEILGLSSTGFAGIIPGSISNINKLEVLSLGKCYFSGLIPGSLSNLTQLTLLDLHKNNLRGHIPSLASLSKLVILSLSDSNFENGRFPYWLSKLTSLNVLYLNRMSISDEIPPSLANLTQLNYIDLQENQLQGPISGSFSNLKNLEFLHLGFNNFSGRVDLDTFVGLNKLKTLSLGYNKISLVGTNNYTDGTLPFLQILGLGSCNLKEFPSFLRFQKNLKYLALGDNQIKGLVPVWIWNNSQETMLAVDLSSNFITGFQQHPRFLPWINLESLTIADNQLQGRLPLPPPKTSFYSVSGNNLTGEIPASICEVKSLQVLDLSFNNLNGTLPPCLESLSNSMSVLNLKRNNFHGTMMNAFTHGSLLRRIDLSENQFTGQLSKSITNCTSLVVLSLGENSFAGIFPYWLGSLAQLQVLILRSNNFYGAIQCPRTNKTQFSNLRIINLSNNSFSGNLPANYIQSWNTMKSVYVGKSVAVNFGVGIGGLGWTFEYSMTLTNKGVKTEYEKIKKVFIVIDLSCNKFEGSIQQELGNLQGLQSLNLSNNHLTGRVLPSLGNLTNLESLDLSHNELSGNIPQQLLQLGYLSIFNVSFNHLDGRIPQGKQFNTFENNSYIGNPGLCGEPLSNECPNSKALTLPVPPTISCEPESLLPGDIIDWIVIFAGFTSGLVIGNVVGNILYARYSDWFVDPFGMRKERWVK